MTTKPACDHFSVGMLVVIDGKLLLVERIKFPFGFAPPAGHVDGASFTGAAISELREETGLDAQRLGLVWAGRKEFPCRRGGDYHQWMVYKALASGDIKRSNDETKQADWYSLPEITKLMKRTKEYLDGKISKEEWELSPGIEHVWYEIFQEPSVLEILQTLD